MHCLLMNGPLLVRSVRIRKCPPLSAGRGFLCFFRLISPHFVRSLSDFSLYAWVECMMISLQLSMLRNRLNNCFRHTAHTIVGAGIIITEVSCSASLRYLQYLSDAHPKIMDSAGSAETRAGMIGEICQCTCHTPHMIGWIYTAKTLTQLYSNLR